MYYVGMTEFSAWAITTSQGIILIDAIYDYSVEDEVGRGLKKLGLNPADIKYVLSATAISITPAAPSSCRTGSAPAS